MTVGFLNLIQSHDKVVKILFFGVLIRVVAVLFDLNRFLADRVEVSTVANGWIYVLEGLYLEENTDGAYSGENFHETPLVLGLARIFQNTIGLNNAWILFIVLDITSAVALCDFARHAAGFMTKQEQKISCNEESKHLLLPSSDEFVCRISKNVLLAYLFNPFLIAGCVSQSTTVLSICFISLSLMFAGRNWRFATDLVLSLAAYQSLYPILMLIPIRAFLQRRQKQESFIQVSSIVFHFALVCLLWLCWITLTFTVREKIDFIPGVYGFHLAADDHTPNFGLYWYFFAEMFDHFRLFFVAIMQLMIFVPVIPLTIKYWNDPELLIYAALTWITVIKPYPSINEYGVCFALIPLFQHLIPFVRQILVSAVMIIVSTVLAPVTWHQWIVTGAGNSNFYYAMTLVFNSAIVMFLGDLLLASMKRNFVLRNGLCKTDKDGKEIVVLLKST